MEDYQKEIKAKRTYLYLLKHRCLLAISIREGLPYNFHLSLFRFLKKESKRKFFTLLYFYVAGKTWSKWCIIDVKYGGKNE